MRTPFDVIHSVLPAQDFAEGYPIGNGRTGGMALCSTKNERIALNHDLLWRRSFTHQNHHTYKDIREIARLCREGKYLDAERLSGRTVPETPNAYYTNPYVPAGDLYINHLNGDSPTEYRRELDMDDGVVSVRYHTNNGADILRECFVSLRENVLVVHVTTTRASELNGEVCLSRLGDAECEVT